MFSMALGAHSIPGFSNEIKSNPAKKTKICLTSKYIRRVRVSSERLLHEASGQRGGGHEKVHCPGAGYSQSLYQLIMK